MGDKKKIVVQTSVKDESLIELRRQQIIEAGVKLFKEKGFHRATTREIAKAAGFSIGTLYEYIRTKEDVLYLVCDHIYNKVTECLSEISTKKGTIEELEKAIRQYFLLIDRMVDEFTVMYQETKSLPKQAMQYVLSKELEMVSLFEKILHNCVKSGEISLTDREIYLAANHLVVQGQSWAFRKWAFHKKYTIEDFIETQIKLFFSGILHFQEK
ncbi:TetR/AcrR family transcriptional regulator [Ureibacillus sp. FSL K6-8385]|uniref:TetR/AcrR family transcriptional regulator n=1 Tax=Ureibacillus terrenus TaxID=118246 RepID=A0A540V2B8_9BACL|nr:TetR/AcrR family transcriptional regulator [Ureibacillus terrenus]MED3661350.1 TetR/AcrR family transcriptional regulator [Ureibacillus terrenus]MED3764179.1 TetR/AcrR family transcriptional regulator [Ureibacillus terrenus]TQE90867.1 TetR/AcrR family transcriptional regulator [Ureibacillus terrenus]